MSILIGGKARADLIDIWRWIANDNPEAASNLLYRPEKAMLVIDAFPEIGPKRPQIAPNARAHFVGAYTILYKIEADNVEVVRVLRSSRNVTRQVYSAGLRR